MTNRPEDECKRPYSLGLRREKSDSKRAAILAEARVQLEQGGLNGFSLEALSRAGGITRQTVYNLFGTRTGLLEALFENGQADYAISLMTSKEERSWQHMIDVGATITMEAWDAKIKPNLDWNHEWGAAPANILSP